MKRRSFFRNLGLAIPAIALPLELLKSKIDMSWIIKPQSMSFPDGLKFFNEGVLVRRRPGSIMGMENMYSHEAGRKEAEWVRVYSFNDLKKLPWFERHSMINWKEFVKIQYQHRPFGFHKDEDAYAVQTFSRNPHTGRIERHQFMQVKGDISILGIEPMHGEYPNNYIDNRISIFENGKFIARIDDGVKTEINYY